jgi:hypothetical protein
MIKINNEIDANIWNNFSENKLFFKYEWLYIVKNTYKLEPFFILCYEDEKFALIASFKTSKGYISLPFVSYSGFCSNDENMLQQLKNYLKNNNIEIDSRDLLKFELTEGYVNPIVTINSYDEFWKNLQPRFRTLMRKSEKKNLVFKIENKISNFYEIYSLGMRNLGTPVHSKKYFYELTKYFNYYIFTVFDGKKPIGSMFCLSDKDTLAVLYAYTSPEYSKQYANYFLYLNAVKWMTGNNLIYLDMGRSTYDEGTFHFKKKFRPKFYGINSKINYGSNTKLQIISKVWTKLPLSVANFVGPKIRRYLP